MLFTDIPSAQVHAVVVMPSGGDEIGGVRPSCDVGVRSWGLLYDFDALCIFQLAPLLIPEHG